MRILASQGQSCVFFLHRIDVDVDDKENIEIEKNVINELNMRKYAFLERLLLKTRPWPFLLI